MFKNYFKIAFRNLWKNKTSSAINIFGLTIGLTSCLLIALYIKHELSFDDFEKKGDRIARVIMQYSFDGSPETSGGNYTSVRVAPVFKRTFPEVESAIKMMLRERIINYNDKYIDEKKFMFADSTFFDMFSFKLLQGDVHSALSGPYKAVVTESTAKKYFGNEDAVGKTFRLGSDSNLYIITGVVEDCPANSQIQFNFMASFSSLGISREHENSYWNANFTTYLLLRDKKSIATLQAKLPAFMKKEMEGQGATVNFFLEPFDQIHLHSPYAGFVPNNNISYIYILAGVALLILVIACSTYINLSTARSIERAKEVGVRKVIGAEKKQLFWQFIGESGLMCMIALVLSFIAAALLLPAFNQLTDKELHAASLFSAQFILFSLLVVVSVSLIAGSYPALVLTGFQPVKVLKGSFKNTGSGQWLRKSLIVFQFAISVFLIVSTFIIQKQLYYIQHKDLGYSREHVLMLPLTNSMQKNIRLIKQEFRQNPDIISVSECDRSPVEGGGGYNMRSATMPANQQIAVFANPIDEDYIETTGMQIIAGANLTEQDIKNASLDTLATFQFILNESAAKQLGWKTPQEAIGKKMFLDDTRPGYVKAVVKDYHFQSLHDPIKSMVLFPENWGTRLLVKLRGNNLPGTISFLETKWKELVPTRPFEYRFMDEDYNKLYNAELRLGKVMNLFSTIAIVLACLGLFGLSSYSAQQRIKEIGIRKVLGASVGSIVIALSKDFVKLSLIAILIAVPVAWWAMSKWLQDFVYRTNMSWSIYFIAGAVTILLAVATVSFHAIRAALMNPVKSLRSE
ncbi:MAG: ABC transporter permease [Bacteroidetes bacterium]|nr:ABC transporter permease [Bacteroidota bacterium]